MNRIIPTYRAESGLFDQIQSSNSITYASEILPVTNKDWKDTLLKRSMADHIQKEYETIAKIGDVDLHPLSSILVTSGWNLNDDVFSAEQLFAARYTPEDKPFNFMHDGNDIIGHIVANMLVDDKYKSLSNSLVVDDLPNNFHILTHAVLYKKWSDETAQARMDDIIANLSKWFVSMECLFTDFDYAVETSNGDQKIVARNSVTAYLTKHLRVYGGSGVYKDEKIGRLLKNITFAGKGLVYSPANPFSIIFANVKDFIPSVARKINVPKKEKEAMSEDTSLDLLKEQNEKLQATVDSLTQKMADQTKQLAESNTDSLNDQITKLTETIQADILTIEGLKSDLDSSNVKNSEVTSKLEDSVVKSEELQTSLDELDAKQREIARMSALKELGKSDEESKSLYTKFGQLDDETFAAMVDTLKSLTPKTDDSETDTAEASANDETLDNAEADTDVNLNISVDTEDDAKTTLKTLASFIAKSCLNHPTEEVV